MEHQSLCSATGMPHSTQIRTRCMGTGVFDEKIRLRNDIPGLQVTVTRCCPYGTSRHRVTPIPIGSAAPESLVRSVDPEKGWYGESLSSSTHASGDPSLCSSPNYGDSFSPNTLSR